jgi:hypothetical protein
VQPCPERQVGVPSFVKGCVEQFCGVLVFSFGEEIWDCLERGAEDIIAGVISRSINSFMGETYQKYRPAWISGTERFLVMVDAANSSMSVSLIIPSEAWWRRKRPRRIGSALVFFANSSRDNGFSLSDRILKMPRSRLTLIEAMVRFCECQNGKLCGDEIRAVYINLCIVSSGGSSEYCRSRNPSMVLRRVASSAVPANFCTSAAALARIASMMAVVPSFVDTVKQVKLPRRDVKMTEDKGHSELCILQRTLGRTSDSEYPGTTKIHPTLLSTYSTTHKVSGRIRVCA